MGTLQQVLVAPFSLAVKCVLFFGAKSQMVWANAPRHIANMQDAKPTRDFAVVKFPREAMGVLEDAMIVASINNELAVTERRGGSRPEPARLGFVDLSPEAISNAHRESISHATYQWTRGQVTAAQVQASRDYFTAMGCRSVC
jgi:hypothetical protein